MRISKQKFTRRNLIIIVIVILLLAGAGVTAWALTGGFSSNDAKKDDTKPENTVDYGNATEEQKEAGNKAKEDFINREYGSASPQPSQSPAVSDITMTITSAGQFDGNLQVRTILETLNANGTCKLTMSHEGSDPIVRSVGTQAMGTYSVCQGFDVPTSGLEKGQWNLRVEYSSGESGGFAERKVDII